MPSKSSAPPDSGMPEEPPIGHRWASEAMHEYVTALRAYALSLREELKELQNHHARLAVDLFTAETALEKREGWIPVEKAPRGVDYLSDGMLTIYAWRHDDEGNDEQLFKYELPPLPAAPSGGGKNTAGFNLGEAAQKKDVCDT